MKLRSITAVGYVIVILGLLALKWLFPVYGSIGFDLLFWAISVMGAYEFLRAVKEVSRAQWWTVMITVALIIPSFVITKMIMVGTGNEEKAAEVSLMVLLAVASVGMMVTAALLVFNFEKSNLKSTALAELGILYCGALGCVGPNINHMVINSLPAVMLLFFLTAGVDTFALIFGKLFGKMLPAKLAPHTSPNKTLIGSIGGIFGGIFASSVMYFMCAYVPGMELSYSGALHPWLLLILIAIPTSVFAQLGDLFESAIKRGCDVKDMGKCLPGHGGMLDRFDSELFAAVAIVVLFLAVR